MKRAKVLLAEVVTASENLAELLTPSDREYIEQLKSPKRRREVSAWRGLLRDGLREMSLMDESLAEIRYTPVGAPYIVDSDIHISVSHCSTMVAVMLSPAPCAIDIEELSRNFTTAAPRYISPSEELLLALGESAEEDAEYPTPPFLPLIWSAKECLYKYSGASELDLKEDLIVESINVLDYTIRGVIDPQDREVMLTYNIVEGVVIVHTL